MRWTQRNKQSVTAAIDWDDQSLIMAWRVPTQARPCHQVWSVPICHRKEGFWYESKEGLAWGRAQVHQCISVANLVLCLPSQTLSHRFVALDSVSSLEDQSTLALATQRAFGGSHEPVRDGMVFDGISDHQWTSDASASTASRWWLIGTSIGWVNTYQQLADQLGFRLIRLDTRLSALLCVYRDQLVGIQRSCWIVHHNQCTECLVICDGVIQAAHHFSTARLSEAEHQSHLTKQLELTQKEWGISLLRWHGYGLRDIIDDCGRTLGLMVSPLSDPASLRPECSARLVPSNDVVMGLLGAHRTPHDGI
jgi:hypothetical protein